MAFDWIQAYYFGIEWRNGRFVDLVNIQVNCVAKNLSSFSFVLENDFVLLIFSEYYWCMLIGRGLGGLSVGALHLLIPMYINDIASAEQKPLYHTIVQLQFVIGILSQYILSEYLA